MDEPDASTDELRRRISELEAENARLRALLGLDKPERCNPTNAYDPRLRTFTPGSDRPRRADDSSPRADKLALYRSLFAGRDDVYALRWESARSSKSGWSPAIRGGPANARRPDRQYLPLTDDVVASHLVGEVAIGLYPLMRGDACRLLACDFDGASWVLDALAYHDAARRLGIPTAIERSRSGDGAHVWTFFSGPVPATSARRLGVALLREAMAIRCELDLASYDRLFPAQDFLPKGRTFGNLIALPLQGQCRRRGNTVFLDPATLEPVTDQWAHLSSVERLSPETVSSLAASLGEIDAGPERVRFNRGSIAGEHPVPANVKARSGAMLAIDRVGLPPRLVSALKHLASLHNPVFYEKERLRFSTHDTPRFIRCYREATGELLLPRGLSEAACKLVKSADSELAVTPTLPDQLPAGFVLRAKLSDTQRVAFDALAKYDLGVLVSPPGTGKTVIACALIAHHDRPTLVIVDRKELLEQWRDRLSMHLEIPGDAVGRLENGRDRQSGAVDITMAQGLARRPDIEEVAAGYGFVVVDECHHVPAVTFERCVRQMPVRRWLGLTATPYRRDGLQGLITMYCGPVRHDGTRRHLESNGIELTLHVHHTGHEGSDPETTSIQQVFGDLVRDDIRSACIADDVVDAVRRGRSCVVLTQWTEHLERIVDAIEERGVRPLVLRGGIGKKARAAVLHELNEPSNEGGLALVATGSYLGEGFDCARLDALFVAFPTPTRVD
jgi:hypothetical protein